VKLSWDSHAAWGAYYGLAIGMFALAGGGPLYFIIPGSGLADLIAQEPGLAHVASTLVANTLACSLIWAGIRASGKWRWLARAGAVALYVALVALTLGRFRVEI
jgi:hypothetical protein